jgi:hypothetical protein
MASAYRALVLSEILSDCRNACTSERRYAHYERTTNGSDQVTLVCGVCHCTVASDSLAHLLMLARSLSTDTTN